jgi:predicted O-linked N-acetylglucosamine transferase (SPINDLY family)
MSRTAADPGAILMQAVQLHQGGQFDAAGRLYQDVLRLIPEQPDAWHLLGVLALQGGRPADAITRIRRAIAARSENAVYHANLGVALQATGQLQEARASLERATALDPRNVDALFNLGVTLQTLGLPDEAAGRYQQVLALVPGHPGARRNLGNALHALGRHAEAVEAYRVVLSLAQPDAGLLGSFGASLAALARHDEATQAFEAAVTLAPGDAGSWLNLAVARHQAGRYDAAAEAYQQGLTLQPEHVEGWHSLGRALVSAQRLDEAIDSLQRARVLVEQRAASAEFRLAVLRDLASALYVTERRVEAAEVLHTIAGLVPDDPEARRNYGAALMASGAIDEAATVLWQAVAMALSSHDYLSTYIYAQDLLSSTTLEDAYTVRRTWNERHARPLAALIQPHTNQPDPARRLRVGYVSADFRQHSASTAFLTVLENHDPATVEVVCYSNNGYEDHVTERFKACAALWRCVSDLTDDELAAQIRADQIDVLVDLSGHSRGNRLLTFARKPAPVQVTAWGHATGTGLDAMDAYLSDPVLVPPDEERWYAEQVVHLPSVICYTTPPAIPPIPPLPALDNGVITFGSFTRIVKVTPAVLETWARVMHAVPGSRLVIKTTLQDSAATRERLLGPLESNGIDRDRVEILGTSPHYEHLASFGTIDVQLDPFPHTGGVSTLDGLLMGIPCVTLLGGRPSARSSASFLTALGLTDLVARTTDEYVEIAARLAGDLERLSHERATLRERLQTSPIGDGRLYTLAVEAAYRALWQRWCEERPAGGVSQEHRKDTASLVTGSAHGRR